jgi:ATP-dependent RNA helicase DDX27
MKILSHTYRVYTKVLVIVPSRELAIQAYIMFNDLNRYTRLSSCLIIGKVDMRKQEAELRNGPDFVIATPGRFVDHLMNSKSIHLEDIEVLILDEADRLLQLGFKYEIQEILACSNPDRQTLLYSATLP